MLEKLDKSNCVTNIPLLLPWVNLSLSVTHLSPKHRGLAAKSAARIIRQESIRIANALSRWPSIPVDSQYSTNSVVSAPSSGNLWSCIAQ